MSRKAFIHINGVDYENAYPVDGESSPEFQALEQKIEKLTSGGGVQVIFDVLMGGERAKLHTTTQGIFAGPSSSPRKARAGGARHHDGITMGTPDGVAARQHRSC
jgi:hypothetical protein